MLGQRGGVISQIKEVIPTALGTHCVAYKPELAVLDTSKSCPQMCGSRKNPYPPCTEGHGNSEG